MHVCIQFFLLDFKFCLFFFNCHIVSHLHLFRLATSVTYLNRQTRKFRVSQEKKNILRSKIRQMQEADCEIKQYRRKRNLMHQQYFDYMFLRILHVDCLVYLSRKKKAVKNFTGADRCLFRNVGIFTPIQNSTALWEKRFQPLHLAWQAKPVW